MRFPHTHNGAKRHALPAHAQRNPPCTRAIALRSVLEPSYPSSPQISDEPFLWRGRSSYRSQRSVFRVAAAASGVDATVWAGCNAARSTGAIVLLTTHDRAAIEGLTDAAVSLVDGRLRES